MDSKDGRSYSDLKSQYSTRRYTYEGYGGQKHDKTLILHKSESCSNDSVLLRLCKRLGGRIAFSSCFRGKLFLAIVVAIMAIFCYFNLFSSHLPQACRVFAVRSGAKLKSLPNETVYVRTRNSLSEKLVALNPILGKSQLVSTFTRQVAFDAREKSFTTTVRQHSKATLLDPITVLKGISVTFSPGTKDLNLEGEDSVDLTERQGPFLAKIEYEEIHRYKPVEADEGDLMYRIVKSGKSASVN